MFPFTMDIQSISSTHVETVVLLSQLKQKPDDYMNVTIELDAVDKERCICYARYTRGRG